MHRTASQGTAWEIPGACLSTTECWWTLQWFPWGRLFFSSNYRWRCSAERKTPFQSVFEKEQFNQPAQNWKGSSTGAIPAGNTLTPGQGKGGSCTDRRSGISSWYCSDTLDTVSKQDQDLPSPALPQDTEGLCMNSFIPLKVLSLPGKFYCPKYLIPPSVLLKEGLVTKPHYSLLELLHSWCETCIFLKREEGVTSPS